SCFNNPLVVEYRGLRNAYGSNVLSNLSYTTCIDNETLINELNDYYKLEGGDALTSAYTLHVSNGASYGQSKYTSKSPSTIELKKTVTAALSIVKGTDGFDKNDDHHYQSKYTLDTTVGYSDTAYVNIQDFISYYKDSGYSVDGSEAHAYTADENTAGEDFVYNPEAISAITDSLSVESLTIVEVKPNGTRNTIFANGDFKNNSGYSFSSAFNSREEAKELSDSEPGVIFTAKLMRDNGEDIPAGTKFEITYNLKINMDDEGGFRTNDFYYGGTLAIGNDAIAERPYSVTRSADAADLIADEDGVISTQSVGDQTLQLAVANEDSDSDSNDGDVSLAGGQVDPDRLVLRAWPDAAIENTFLTDEILLKYPVGQPTNDIGTSWMEYDWSGTIGKHKPNIRLIDNCVIVLNDLFAERTDLTDEQKEALRVKCASLMLDYITISDVKLYETTNKPYVTSSGTSLTDNMLIWQKDGVLNEDFTGETINGHALTIGYTPATLIDFKETGRTEVQSPTFDIKVSDVDYGTYIASTYNINVDWEAYSKRLQEEDLLDSAGYATGTHQIPVFTFTNYVVNDRDMGCSSSSGEIKVSSTTFSKNVQETDTQAGNATWNLNTTLSNTFNGDAITFTDKPGFTAQDEAVAKAAESATSIENVQVKQGETVVFKDGKVTDEGAAAGWTADNVEVRVDGLSLEVKVKNTDSAKV
ncbi:MAG: hypothetical protein Q3982_08470, partial [Phoenicibacter congonensis]|nr:hypothetical protein [Phoenicibacter congonensis]